MERPFTAPFGGSQALTSLASSSDSSASALQTGDGAFSRGGCAGTSKGKVWNVRRAVLWETLQGREWENQGVLALLPTPCFRDLPFNSPLCASPCLARTAKCLLFHVTRLKTPTPRSAVLYVGMLTGITSKACYALPLKGMSHFLFFEAFKKITEATVIEMA